MQRLLNHLLATQDFDVVQVENSGFGNYRIETTLPSVLTELEVGRSLPGDENDWKQVQPAIWRQFNRIQVFTPRDAAEIRAVAPELSDRVRINPFGIDIPEEADPGLEEPGTVVFVGGFNHLPNVDAALWLGNEIMPLLRRLRNGIRLIIVGDNPSVALRALACDDMIVTGRVPSVEPYLDRAAVVLAPVRLGGGMRVKVLEAMAMGKAVVTTPLGAEGLLGPRNALPLAIGETAEEVATATASLLASPEHRRALGTRARAFVTEYHSWSAYAARLEAIYAELLLR
jgi:glycosyltransferase involved in cell wall biosynthesis